MTSNPITANAEGLAAELVDLMKQKRIGAIIVTDNDKAIGALNMQDLLRAGIL